MATEVSLGEKPGKGKARIKQYNTRLWCKMAMNPYKKSKEKYEENRQFFKKIIWREQTNF